MSMIEHMYTLYLIRGLPGSGKSVLGKLLSGSNSFEADDYFIKEGVYKFDPSQLSNAHEFCQFQVRASMEEMIPTIAVCNTFSEQWEVDPYLEMLKEHNLYTVNIIECQSDYGSVHGVPDEAVQSMRDRWCSSITLSKVFYHERLHSSVSKEPRASFKPDKYDGVPADTGSI